MRRRGEGEGELGWVGSWDRWEGGRVGVGIGGREGGMGIFMEMGDKIKEN